MPAPCPRYLQNANVVTDSKLNALRSASEGQLGEAPVDQRDGRFVELNVLGQMRSLQSFPEIASAMESRGLTIHGIVYDRGKNEVVRLEAESEY